MNHALPLIFIALSMPGLALAQASDKHLKGEVTAIDDKQLTLTTEKKEAVTLSIDKQTQFENNSKASTASELPVGTRATVKLRAGAKAPTAAVVTFIATAPAAERIEVSVTSDGFTLAHPRAVKVGRPVTLVVTRTTEKTCATDIVLKEFGISKPLPLNKSVEVSFVPKKAGKVHFACAMDMVSGDLTVE